MLDTNFVQTILAPPPSAIMSLKASMIMVCIASRWRRCIVMANIVGAGVVVVVFGQCLHDTLSNSIAHSGALDLFWLEPVTLEQVLDSGNRAAPFSASSSCARQSQYGHDG